MSRNGTSGNNGRLDVRKTYKMLIGGAFVRSESGRALDVESPGGKWLGHVCRASRKDFRNAVVAARKAASGWAGATAYLKGQILYRAAEMLEGRASGFCEVLQSIGLSAGAAKAEVSQAVDLLVYYAGWSDKYLQVFGAVNPVATPHFNFSVTEPMGVVAYVSGEKRPLLDLVSGIAPIVVGGNTVITLSTGRAAVAAMELGEVLETSDFPPGVINLLCGLREELVGQMSSHMDVNALVVQGGDQKEHTASREACAMNLKRYFPRDPGGKGDEDPYRILDTVEIKTTWHPVGG
ncbi:aldehyde dehydrogenase family protein [bacterium]|nr:aldehyde dehydrogenase family protein [bacterium]